MSQNGDDDDDNTTNALVEEAEADKLVALAVETNGDDDDTPTAAASSPQWKTKNKTKESDSPPPRSRRRRSPSLSPKPKRRAPSTSPSPPRKKRIRARSTSPSPPPRKIDSGDSKRSSSISEDLAQKKAELKSVEADTDREKKEARRAKEEAAKAKREIELAKREAERATESATRLAAHRREEETRAEEAKARGERYEKLSVERKRQADVINNDLLHLKKQREEMFNDVMSKEREAYDRLQKAIADEKDAEAIQLHVKREKADIVRIRKEFEVAAKNMNSADRELQNKWSQLTDLENDVQKLTDKKSEIELTTKKELARQAEIRVDTAKLERAQKKRVDDAKSAAAAQIMAVNANASAIIRRKQAETVKRSDLAARIEMAFDENRAMFTKHIKAFADTFTVTRKTKLDLLSTAEQLATLNTDKKLTAFLTSKFGGDPKAVKEFSQMMLICTMSGVRENASAVIDMMKREDTMIDSENGVADTIPPPIPVPVQPSALSQTLSGLTDMLAAATLNTIKT